MKSLTILFGLVFLSNQLTAQQAPPDEAKVAKKQANDFPTAERDYFRDMDMIGDPNNSQPVAAKHLPLELDEIKGRNTWLMWCGGNEAFWDWLAKHSYGFLDFLKIVGSPSYEVAADKRKKRFKEMGLVNEPGCQPIEKADDYSGLFLEQPDPESHQPREDVYGRSSGVVGLRLFKNPAFNNEARKNWNVQKYFADKSYFNDPKLVRPYRIGMSCAFCHVAPHPLNPPADPENPKWENLSSVIGNQYFRTRAIVGSLLSSDNFVYHVLDSQPPGTIDTSLVASDNINNTNTMNAVFELPERLRRAGAFLAPGEREHFENLLGINRTKLGENNPEKQSSASLQLPSVLPDNPNPTQNPRAVPRVLLDGADSIGAYGALARVYLNIGTYSERWNQLHNPLIGFVPQKPFKISDCDENSVYWQVTKIRTPDLARFFLKSTPAMRLKDAPGGIEFLKKDSDGRPVGVPWDPALKEGRRVFAQNCIACHSSKQPDFFEDVKASDLLNLLHKPDQPFYSRYREWALAAVENPEFWQGNYLSTDRRVPVSLIGTNAGRALASNGIASHMWEDFTSEDYKKLDPVGTIQIFNPYKPPNEKEMFNDVFVAPAGGRGYYRPASLVSVWATAPFLHNNSVGIFNNDPSVKGRMDAFNDGISKLLVQARRDENDDRPWEELVVQVAKKRYLGYKDESLGWKAPDLDGADAARLEKDHGLIWRTTQETSIQIPGSQLGELATRLTGLPLPFLDQIPWIIPAVVILIGFLILFLTTRSRWFRVFRFISYAFFLVGILIAGWFSVILRGDFKLGAIPAGTPVDLIANLDPDKMDQTVAALKLAIWTTKELKKLDPNKTEDQKRAEEFRSKLGQALLNASKCPDLVMDRGHYTAAALTPKEQQELIDLIKTF
jgi:hypothetical protein